MKRPAFYLICFLMLAVSLPLGMAQDKGKTDDKPKPDFATTPIKVQIVFTEFDGDKKVKSLPYTLYNNTGSELRPGATKLRIGSRVPVYLGNAQMQYIDIGTNLDCRAVRNDDGHFVVQLSLERSWVEGDVLVSMRQSAVSAQAEGTSGPFKQPLIHQVRSDLDLSMRDATIESTVATDPISGRLLRVDVTLNVLK